MILKPSEAQAFYDRFGKKQVTQCFYEDPAIDDLIINPTCWETGYRNVLIAFGVPSEVLVARVKHYYHSERLF